MVVGVLAWEGDWRRGHSGAGGQGCSHLDLMGKAENPKSQSRLTFSR